MINDKKTTWHCAVCNRYTNVLHEAFFGSSLRKISIEYDLQVPLCPICHTVAHTRDLLHGCTPLAEMRNKNGLDKKMIQSYLCDKLGIDRDRTSLAVNRMNDEDIEYLEKISKKCYTAIDNMRVI